MLNSEFEKNVKQQLDELSFAPSDAVWNKVEASLPEEKRKRRWILLLFPLILAASLLTWYLSMPVKNSAEGSDQSTQQPTANSGKNSTVSSKITAPVNDNSFTADEKLKSEAQLQTDEGVTTSIVKQQKSSTNHTATESGNNKRTEPGQKNVNLVARKSKSKSEVEIRNEDLNPQMNKNDVTAPEYTIVEKSVKKDYPSIDKQPDNVSTDATGNASDYTIIDSTKTIVQVNKETDKQPADIQKTDTTDLIKNTAGSEKSKKSWLFGIHAGIGISNVKSKLFNQEKFLMDMSSGSSGNPQTTPTQTFSTPSGSRSSVAYSAGVFAEKKIKQLSFIGELTYSYYSNTVIADKADSAGINYYFFQPGTTERYTNKFHYASLAVLLQYKFKKPFFVEGGFTTAYLVSTNALQYQSGRNFYQQNKELFNSMLFSLNAGAGVKLTSDVTIGYRFGYSLGSISKTSDNQHLISSLLYLNIPLKKK